VDEPWQQRVLLFLIRVLTRALERSGPAFVKLAQYASTRPDVLPPAICARLGALQDSTEPHSWADSEAELERALGPDWEQALEIKPQDRERPVGSGCIAQVHRGRLLRPPPGTATAGIGCDPTLATAGVFGECCSADDDDEDDDSVYGNATGDTGCSSSGSGGGGGGSGGAMAAVKIVHPSVRWVLSRDLAILRALARLAAAVPAAREVTSLMSPVRLVAEFELMMRCQLDLRHEAANLEMMRLNFGIDPYTPTAAAVLDRGNDPSAAVAAAMKLAAGPVAAGAAPESRTAAGYAFAPARASRPRPAAPFALELPRVFHSTPSVLVERFHTGVPASKLIKLVIRDRESEIGGADAPPSSSSSSSSPPAQTPASASSVVPPVSADRPASTTSLQLRILSSLSPTQRDTIAREIAAAGLNAFLQMLFRHAFFHADLHPGNIIVDLGYDWHPHRAAETCATDTAAGVNATFLHPGDTVGVSAALDALARRGVPVVDPAQAAATAAADGMQQQMAAARVVASAPPAAPTHVDLPAQLRAGAADLYARAVGLCRHWAPALADALPPPSAAVSGAGSEDLARAREWALPFAPLSMFPSTVFQALHPDDCRLHESFTEGHPQAYQLWFLQRGLPLPPRQPRIVLIDAGMATPLSASEMTNFRDLFYAVALRQGRVAAEMMIDRAPAMPDDPPRSPEDREQFVRTVAGLIDAAASTGFQLSSVGVVETLQGLVTAARTHRVRLDPAFLSVIVAVTVTEGVGRSLDPAVDIVTPAIAVVAKARLDEIIAARSLNLHI
jgi:predicted unusual protein kinase regulating ubiquinone biosynthesis (AarF/ABC1/UbiB family)